jgi:hypothetical protein
MILKKLLNSSFFINLFGFLLAVLVVSILAFYQVFVDKNYQRIPVKLFFKPQFLNLAYANLFKNKTKIDLTNLYWLDDKTIFNNPNKPIQIVQSVFKPLEPIYYFNKNKQNLAYINSDNDLIISNLKDQNLSFKSLLPDYQIIKIINWDNDNSLYLALKQDTWAIIKISNNKVFILADKINYPHDQFGEAISIIDKNLVYPQCQKICEFVIKNINNNGENIVPAIAHSNPSIRLEDINYLFFDGLNELIAYENPKVDDPYLYIINFKGELIQSITLRTTPQTLIKFVGYYPDNQYLLLNSYNDKRKIQEIFAYSANFPSLRVLGHYQNKQEIRALDNSGFYILGQTIRNINDENFKLNLNNKQFVAVY